MEARKGIVNTAPALPAEPQAATDQAEPDERAGGVFLHWRGRKRSKLLVPAPRVLETVAEESDPTEEDR